jgi:hypothetical protein
MSVSKKPSRGQGSGGKPAAPKPKRGRKYGPGEKKAILEAARGSSMLLAAAEYGVSPPTLYRWRGCRVLGQELVYTETIKLAH